ARMLLDLVGNVAESRIVDRTPAPRVESFSNHVSRDVTLIVFVVVFLALDPEKDSAQDHSADEKAHERPAFALMRRPHRHGHGKTGSDQHQGVGEPPRDADAGAAGDEGIVILDPVDQVGSEKAAEHHDFRQQEHPHAKGGRALLLRHAVKLMRQRRMMFSRRGLASGQRLPPGRSRSYMAARSQPELRGNYASAAANWFATPVPLPSMDCPRQSGRT